MIDGLLLPLFNIVVFPGLLFLIVLGFVFQFIDRKVYARLQNRIGPPFLQPIADFIKLSAKQEILPEQADARMFKVMPFVAMASAATAIIYIPLWSAQPLYSFYGDLLVVLYLLLLPTLAAFLGGIYSTSLFSTLGAVRVITQLFAYEVPLFLALLSPALLADSWSIAGIAAYYEAHPWRWCVNLLGFAIGLVAALGKLEKVPFDIPDAETEIVGGTFTEYSGRLLALFRLTIDIEAVIVASLFAAIFLPFGLGLPPLLGFLAYLGKVTLVVLLLSLLRTVMARLRIDQMMDFCWKVLAPLAFLQMLVSLILKGLLQ